MLLAKPRSRFETVNDLDGELMLFWRVLRDRPAELARVCALTPHSRGEFAVALDTTAGQMVELPELERARRTWVRLSQGRGRATGRRTGWRHYRSAGSQNTGMPQRLGAYVDRIDAVATRMAGVSLECRPALDVIDRYGARPDVLIYADPPYLGSARQDPGASYGHELRSEGEHRALAVALHGCSATVVLSGYPSPLYEELYAGWYRHELSGQSQRSGGYTRTREVLWSNRPLSDRLPIGGDL